MQDSITRRITLNAALLIDAAACFAGACVLLLAPTVWSITDLPQNWRLPVVVALFAFSVLLVLVARYPTRPLVAMAVLGNLAWISAGAIALFVTGTLWGSVVIAAVMLADACMAWIQARPLLATDGKSA